MARTWTVNQTHLNGVDLKQSAHSAAHMKHIAGKTNLLFPHIKEIEVKIWKLNGAKIL